MPRAKKTADQKHDHIVKLSLTPALYDRLAQRASATKMPLASYCRTLLEGSEPPAIIPEINYQAYRDLSRPLSNLNQLLKLLRAAEQQGLAVSPSLLEALAMAIAVLKSLMLEALLGTAALSRAWLDHSESR
jgi:hypothetical protein